MQLENKVAAVTGGTAGIGKAIVEIFLENGAKVAMMARNSEKSRKSHLRSRSGGQANLY